MSHQFQHEIILAALPNSKANAVTVSELYDSLDDADKGRFGGTVQLTRALNAISKNKLKGKIANGQVEYVKGSARLTWYKTEASNEQQNLVSKPTTGCEDQPTDNHPLEAPEISAVTLENDPIETTVDLQDQQISIDSALETLASDGYLFLDPNDEIESSLITMANYMRQARDVPEPPKIERKDEKIQLLQFFKGFHGKLNEDVDQVLADIIADYEQFEAA